MPRNSESLYKPNMEHTVKVTEILSKILQCKSIEEYKTLFGEIEKYPDYDGMILVGFTQAIARKEIELAEEACRLKKGVMSCPCPDKIAYDEKCKQETLKNFELNRNKPTMYGYGDKKRR